MEAKYHPERSNEGALHIIGKEFISWKARAEKVENGRRRVPKLTKTGEDLEEIEGKNKTPSFQRERD